MLENTNALSIPCLVDERGVLPVANLFVHRCAPAAEMVSVHSPCSTRRHHRVAGERLQIFAKKCIVFHSNTKR